MNKKKESKILINSFVDKDDLLKADLLVEKGDFESRSQLIRKALKEFLVNHNSVKGTHIAAKFLEWKQLGLTVDEIKPLLVKELSEKN